MTNENAAKLAEENLRLKSALARIQSMLRKDTSSGVEILSVIANALRKEDRQ